MLQIELKRDWKSYYLNQITLSQIKAAGITTIDANHEIKLLTN